MYEARLDKGSDGQKECSKAGRRAERGTPVPESRHDPAEGRDGKEAPGCLQKIEYAELMFQVETLPTCLQQLLVLPTEFGCHPSHQASVQAELGKVECEESKKLPGPRLRSRQGHESNLQHNFFFNQSCCKAVAIATLEQTLPNEPQ